MQIRGERTITVFHFKIVPINLVLLFSWHAQMKMGITAPFQMGSFADWSIGLKMF
jgi:hypothetical protein